MAGDRWSLEALGIGASDDWDSCLSSWLEMINNNWDTPGGRKLFGEAEQSNQQNLSQKSLIIKKTPLEERPKYFRALDFQSASHRDEALLEILESNP